AFGCAFWLSDAVERDGIRTAITGALALAAHGVPRMTKDVDLAVYVGPGEQERFLDALERAGCLFDRSLASREIERIGWFPVRCGRIQVDLFVAQHPFHPEAMGRRRRVAIPGGGERWFHSAEDLAVNKLALYRPRDIGDLELLFAARASDLDVPYIRRWIEAITSTGDPRRAALEDLV